MGERFGAFEVEGKLGAGGMAEVHVARRCGPGGFEQRLCLKRILPAWAGDARILQMFREEARVSARLRHASLVQLIEAGEHEGVPYLALELVEGADLRKLIEASRGRGGLPAEVVGLIAVDLATALEVAHREGILHRDVSPSNVLVSRAGEVKLADFGIAKASDSPLRTATGVPKGKVQYMAPEYALSGAASARSDLYALGITLFEAATGVLPFKAATLLASLTRARQNERPRVRALAPGLPPVLEDAIERLVQPVPEARFKSAAALYDALSPLAPSASVRRSLGALARRAGTRSTASVARPQGTVPEGSSERGTHVFQPPCAVTEPMSGGALALPVEPYTGLPDARPPAADTRPGVRRSPPSPSAGPGGEGATRPVRARRRR